MLIKRNQFFFRFRETNKKKQSSCTPYVSAFADQIRLYLLPQKASVAGELLSQPAICNSQRGVRLLAARGILNISDNATMPQQWWQKTDAGHQEYRRLTRFKTGITAWNRLASTQFMPHVYPKTSLSGKINDEKLNSSLAPWRHSKDGLKKRQ